MSLSNVAPPRMAPTIARRTHCSAILAVGLLALTACVRLDPAEPAPPVDPGPPPVVGTPCERSCERYAQLACMPAILNCVEACDASESTGLAFSWQPELQSEALSCAEWNRRATEAR